MPTLPPRASARHLDSIVVTSARRDPFGGEALQHRAGAATHLSAQRLADQHVTSVTSLQNLVPNLTIQPQGATSDVNFALRGVGLKDFTGNNTPPVMTYLDGVALPIGYMAGNALFDLAGVDVAPGPAGFTHGQTVTAGEVNITTNAPTKALQAGVTQDIANRARSITSFFVSGALGGHVQARLAGLTQHGGGYQINRYDGKPYGNANFGALRLKLAWQPGPDTDVLLSGNWMHDASDAPGVFVVQSLIRPFLPPDRNNRMTGWGFRPQFTDLIGVKTGTKPFYNDTVWGSGLHVEHRFPWAVLSSRSAFQQMYIHNLVDADSSDYATYDGYLTNNASLFSQEVSLTSRPTASRVAWTIGAYYDRTRTKASFYNDFAQSLVRPYISDSHYRQNQQALSQYGQMTVPLTQRLLLSVAVSHERDERALLDLHTTQFGVRALSFGPHDAIVDQFAGKGALAYRLSPAILLYADIRRGFKPGGFKANDTVIAQQLNPTRPETLLAYEIGTKSAFLNDRLRLNASAFYYRYHDQQLLGLQVVPAYGTVGEYVNIPRSTIYGIEGELDYVPVPHLTLTQHFGYERGIYNEFNYINSTAVYANFRKTGVYAPFYTSFKNSDTGIPKLTLNGMIQYEIKTHADWHVIPQISYAYRGSQLDTPGNPVYRLPAYCLVNAMLSLRPPTAHWSLKLYATNMLDRHYDLTRDLALNAFYGVPGPPRFVGAAVSVRE